MMSLDPKAKAILTAEAAAGSVSVHTMPAAQARVFFESRYEQISFPLKQIKSLEERKIPGPGGDLTLRIYTPFGRGPFPLLRFIHGGGWVLFRPVHYDSVCTYLCEGSGFIVVSVDYRLSPETKYPGALNDCHAALKWVSAHATEIDADASRIIISGDSGGGNLAAALALKNRDEDAVNLQGQLLIYPALAWYDPPTPSLSEFAGGYSLTLVAMEWFWKQYLASPAQSSEPYAVPMKAASLANLPETLLIVAGYDPLRDEGVDYALRLEKEGTAVTLVRYDSMIHGFLSYLGILEQAETAITGICGWLRTRTQRS